MTDDAWTPAFPGQRPPFTAGHTLSVRHGAYSPRTIEPLAEQLIAEVLADDTTAYLTAPSYAATLAAWAAMQARAEVFGAYLAGLSVQDQLMPPRGGAKSPLDVWLSMVKTAAGLADKLGLTPLSRARLSKDVAITGSIAHAGMDRLRTVGAELVAQARARGALSGPETGDLGLGDGQGEDEEDGRGEC